MGHQQLADRPVRELDIPERAVDGPHRTPRPEPLHLIVHPVSEHGLHEAVDHQGPRLRVPLQQERRCAAMIVAVNAYRLDTPGPADRPAPEPFEENFPCALASSCATRGRMHKIGG